MSNTSISLRIIGGFLGSGKTTVLNNILNSLPENKRTAVIVNDFGEVNIDGMLLEKGNYSKKEISGGCICCSLREKLLDNLLTILRDEQPDEVYIEATGLAVPWEMKKTIEDNFGDRNLTVEEVLVCTDVKQWERYQRVLPAYKRQFEGSPTILFTKADLYDENLLEKTAESMGSIYPAIRKIRKSINGSIEGELDLPESSGIRTTIIPYLLNSKDIPGDKSQIAQISIEAGPMISLDSFKALVLENKDRIIRLKTIYTREQSVGSLHFDGEHFYEQVPPAELEMEDRSFCTVFCFEKDKEELDQKFRSMFKRTI